MRNTHHHMLSERQALDELASFAHRRDVEIAAVQEEYSAKWTQEKRNQAEKSGDALPGGKFPIKDQEDLDNANTLKGNSSVPNAVVERHMKKQAKKHGLRLPKSLQSNSTS